MTCLSEYEFFISGNTPSSKNNKEWTGELLVMGKNAAKWVIKTKEEFKMQAMWFYYMACILPNPPLYVEFTFIRRTRHDFDYINAAQIVQDQMKKLLWIDDDGASIMKPVFGDFIYDKYHPGVYIRLLKEAPIVEGEPKFREKILDRHKPPQKISKRKNKPK